jgi:glutaredoxin
LRLLENMKTPDYDVSMHEVVVYSRQGCHLCDVVKAILSRLAGRGDFCWCEVDIDTDEELLRLYNESVPVVFIDGRKAFKFHMSEKDFVERLRRGEKSE